MAKILGIGGVFFKSKDPSGLAAWYRRWLGVAVEEFGGVVFPITNLAAGSYTVWSPFSNRTRYFTPSRKPFLINFIVDDLDAILDRLRESDAQVMEKRERSEFGYFGWFVDPEGNKIELWEPPGA